MKERNTCQSNGFFECLAVKINDERELRPNGWFFQSTALVRIKINGETVFEGERGKEPLSALHAALKKALRKFYPEVEILQLKSFSVDTRGKKKAKREKRNVIVGVVLSNENSQWVEHGVDEDNILQAGIQALLKGFQKQIFSSLKI